MGKKDVTAEVLSVAKVALVEALVLRGGVADPPFTFAWVSPVRDIM